MHSLLLEVYGDKSTAALVMAYIDGKVNFVTPDVFATYVEGHNPKKLARELKILRREGRCPIAFLKEQALQRGRMALDVAAIPMPKTFGASQHASRADVLQTLILDAEF